MSSLFAALHAPPPLVGLLCLTALLSAANLRVVPLWMARAPPRDAPPPAREEDAAAPSLDFAVAGFPKTGTTFLLGVLGRHPDVVMPPREHCSLHNSVDETRAWLAAEGARNNATEATGTARRYGIKCPTMVREPSAVERAATLGEGSFDLVVGVRHPVLWFQSFYNYR